MRQIFAVLFFIALLINTMQGQGTLAKNAIDSLKSMPITINLNNFKYPQLAIDNSIQGTVIIKIDVDSTCSIINRRVINGLGFGCDEAVLNALDESEINLKKEHNSKCFPIYDLKIPKKFTLLK